MRWRGIIVFFSLIPSLLLAATVEVEVSERGKDATEARIKALTSAEQQAFKKLLEEKHPKKVDEIFKGYTPEAISQMVQSYEIIEEAMTPNSYKATMKVIFNDSAIGKLGLKPAEREATAVAAVPDSDAVLVIPVLFNDKGILLWETGNEWRAAVNLAALQAPRQRWIVPMGDPQDVMTVDSSQVLSADFSRLAPLAARYGAGSVLVAVAKSGEGALAVELRHLSAKGAETEIMNLTADATLTSPKALLTRAADELLVGSAEKQPEALPQSATDEVTAAPTLHEINLLVKLSRARDWAEIRHRLLTIEGVEKLEVTAANWQQMQLRLNYRGFPEDLGESLAKNGLDVLQQDDMLLLRIK